MNHGEFAAWLGQEIRETRLEEYQVADFLAQRLLFDKDRKLFESEFRLKAVGYVANNSLLADSVSEILDQAKKSPDRMLYFELIGHR